MPKVLMATIPALSDLEPLPIWTTDTSSRRHIKSCTWIQGHETAVRVVTSREIDYKEPCKFCWKKHL